MLDYQSTIIAIELLRRKKSELPVTHYRIIDTILDNAAVHLENQVINYLLGKDETYKHQQQSMANPIQKGK